MEKKKQTATIAAAFLAGIAIMAAFSLGAGSSKGADEAGVMKFKNWISLEVVHPDGTREPTQIAPNTVTNYGLNYTRDFLAGFNASRPTNWTFIQLSTDGGAPAATDATCPSAVSGNGLDIAVGTTVIVRNTGNYTVSKTFSVTGTQSGIQKVCLHNDTATGGPLMASATISSTNVASGDTLIINYSVAAT